MDSFKNKQVDTYDILMTVLSPVWLWISFDTRSHFFEKIVLQLGQFFFLFCTLCPGQFWLLFFIFTRQYSWSFSTFQTRALEVKTKLNILWSSSSQSLVPLTLAGPWDSMKVYGEKLHNYIKFICLFHCTDICTVGTKAMMSKRGYLRKKIKAVAPNHTCSHCTLPCHTFTVKKEASFT